MEMTAAQFKLATVVDTLIAKSPLYGGGVNYEPILDKHSNLVGSEGIRVTWSDVDLRVHSFEIRVREIEKCQDMESAVRVVLDKMGPGHSVKHLGRRKVALTPDKAPDFNKASIRPRDIFEQRVVACETCETLGDPADTPGMSCPKDGCEGKLAYYRVVVPKFPGQFKPFNERIDVEQPEDRRERGGTRPDRGGPDPGDGPPG